MSLDEHGNNALFHAIRCGRDPSFIEHLVLHVDIHDRNDKGQQAVHVAAEQNDLAVIFLLKRLGANILARDGESRNIAECAHQKKVVLALEELLKETRQTPLEDYRRLVILQEDPSQPDFYPFENV